MGKSQATITVIRPCLAQTGNSGNLARRYILSQKISIQDFIDNRWAEAMVEVERFMVDPEIRTGR